MARKAFLSAIVVIFIFLLLPLVLVIPLSFTSSKYMVLPPPGWSLRWYRNFLENPIWRDSLYQSLRIATLSMFISTSLGTAASFPLVRTTFPGARLLLLLLISPIVVPQIVIAIGNYFVALPLGLTDHWWVIALAQSVISVPVVVIIMTAALKGFDHNLEFAALSLGASPIQALSRVTLPLIAPAIVTSAIFSFMWSFDNFIVPLFLGGITVFTLPLRIWGSMRSSLDITMLAVSTILLLVTALAVTATMRLDSGRT